MTKCAFIVDGRFFSKEAIVKTAHLFSNEYFVNINCVNNEDIRIEIESKNDIKDENIDKRFKNELLAQMLRYQISESRKNGRALYSTCIDTAEDINDSSDEGVFELSLDDIAVDWFEIN